MQNDNAFLGTEKIGKLLFRLALPAVTAQLVNMLYNLVDRICRVLGEGLKTVRFVLPYSQAGVLDRLYREANVKKADYVENGIDIEAVVDRKTYGRIRELLPQDQREPDHEVF